MRGAAFGEPFQCLMPGGVSQNLSPVTNTRRDEINRMPLKHPIKPPKSLGHAVVVAIF
jgi:hypothetical protein